MPDPKRVAIVQSNYVPWRGYFDLIASVDEFIFLDDAQYTRRDWRNRNRIKTPQGSRWLTIPVQVSGRYTQAIYETHVVDDAWAEQHWDILRQNYRHAHGFASQEGFLRSLYEHVPGTSLSDINRHFVDGVCQHLGIETPLRTSVELAPEGVKSERLLDICQKVGATQYVSGPAARAYLDADLFAASGIEVTWFAYGPYEAYEQVHPPFDPQVSVLDVLLCAGEDAPRLARPVVGSHR